MSTISTNEAIVMAVLEHDAKATLEEIAAVTRLKSHTIAYCREKLLRQKLIGPLRASINKYRLGICQLHIMFSIVTAKNAKQEEAITWLKKNQHTGWLAEVGGSYQYALTLRTINRFQEVAFIKNFCGLFPHAIRTHSIAMITAIHSFGRRFIGPSSLRRNVFVHEITQDTTPQIDALDCKILTALATGEYRSERELSNKIDIPQPTVRRRIAHLSQEGIIAGYYHHIDTSKIGYQHFKLQITTLAFGDSFIKAVRQFAKGEEHVVHLIEAIGAWQAELQIETRDATHATQIANDLRSHLGALADSVTTIPILHVLYAVPFNFLGSDLQLT